MKIVFATDNYWPRFSGMAVSIDAFKKELEKHGHTVYIFAPEYPDAPAAEKEQKEKKIYRFKSHRLLITKDDRLVSKREKTKVFSLLDSIKPDIIHVQTEFNMGRLAWTYALKNNISLIMTSHTYWEEYIPIYMPFLPGALTRLYARARLRRTFALADLVITPTSAMKDVLRSYKVRKPIEVIPTGIDPIDFKGVTKKREHEQSELFKTWPQLKEKKILLYLGRVAKEKNPGILLDVLESILPESPNARLLIVGDGPYRKEMEKTAAQKGLAEYVVFTGYISRKKVKYIYTLADVFVNPSKTESQGLATIEAMFCGTPVVAIGEMGTKYVMNGDNGGYMVMDSLEIFSEAVLLLLKDEELYEQKSEEALRYSQNWTIENIISRLINAYETTLEEKIRIRI